jgi:hypothetical protein
MLLRAVASWAWNACKARPDWALWLHGNASDTCLCLSTKESLIDVTMKADKRHAANVD